MQKLNEILDSFCAKGEKTTKDEILGATFIVVGKDGNYPPSGPSQTFRQTESSDDHSNHSQVLSISTRRDGSGPL